LFVLLKKNKNFCYICNNIVIEKDKYGLLILLYHCCHWKR